MAVRSFHFWVSAFLMASILHFHHDEFHAMMISAREAFSNVAAYVPNNPSPSYAVPLDAYR
jgi:arginine/lysine/ornithine decarboxylase